MKTTEKNHVYNKIRKRLSDKGYALISALVLLAVFSVIGTSMVALSIRQTKSAANDKIELSYAFFVDQAAENLIQDVNKTINSANEIDYPSLAETMKTKFGIADTNTSFKLYINRAERREGMSDEEYTALKEQSAVVIDNFSLNLSGTATEGFTFTLSFTATYGNKKLNVTTEFAKATSEADYTAKTTKWNYQRTA